MKLSSLARPASLDRGDGRAAEASLTLQIRWLDAAHRRDGLRGRFAVGRPFSGAATLRFASE
jgi:hypothetical protein